MNDTPEPFLGGLAIGRLFYRDIIEPVIQKVAPDIKYAAALIGPGSEVLGFDTALSADHDWKPRVSIFLGDDDFSSHGKLVAKAIAESLPETYRGFPIAGFPSDVSHIGDVRYQTVFSVRQFWQMYIGFDINQKINTQDWLTFPEHMLLGLTSGEIYRDDTGELTRTRERFAYYPNDIRLYMAAAEWSHIAQEEAFLGRTGDVGDEIGSRLIAGRLIRHIMRLCFILEQKYCPYTKWFGSAFSRLACAEQISPLIEAVLDQKHWTERELCMSALYRQLIAVFQKYHLTKKISDDTVSSYYTRPYQVSHAGRFAAALLAEISSSEIKKLTPNIGSVNQFIDCHDILSGPNRTKHLIPIYQNKE